jgi:hypothetical protein
LSLSLLLLLLLLFCSVWLAVDFWSANSFSCSYWKGINSINSKSIALMWIDLWREPLISRFLRVRVHYEELRSSYWLFLTEWQDLLAQYLVNSLPFVNKCKVS